MDRAQVSRSPFALTRVQCDEQKPRCSGCARHETDCVYPQPLGNSSSNFGPTTNSSPASISAVRTIRHPGTVNETPATQLQNLDFENLELLHQWLTYTCFVTSQLPEETLKVQRDVPRLAHGHPFFMHGVLAEAAVHLSWLRPQQRQHYNLLAAKHHRLALPDFRSTLDSINESNYSALIAYSFSLVWCAFAKFISPPTAGSTIKPSDHNGWLPEWFSLLRGSCIIVESCKVWINDGIHVLPQVDNSAEFWQSLDHRRIAALRSKLVPLSKSRLCHDVLSLLHHSFALASMRHYNTPLRNAINHWISKIPNDYMRLLQKGEPWALVIMAHFCILVYRSETLWFMKGHAARFLQSISDRLEESWQQYVQWPHDEVGVTEIT